MPGPLRDMIMDGLISMDAFTLQRIAKDRSATRVLQVALNCSNQDHAARFRRTIVQRLTPHVVDLALDTTASHVVDVMYEASQDLRYPREQVAARLAKAEDQLRLFPSGKAVWRNWEMDLYKRSRKQWVHQDKIEDLPTLDLTRKGKLDREEKLKKAAKPKTAIELARERYAAGTSLPSKSRKEDSNPNHMQPGRIAVRAAQGHAER